MEGEGGGEDEVRKGVRTRGAGVWGGGGHRGAGG